MENTHEPLIDRETFDKVQELAQRKNEESPALPEISLIACR